MRLISIEINNMFSYNGKHEIIFNNRTCIIGTNGLGKTSILNAIKLCLGHISIPAESVLNNNASEKLCSVKLVFDECIIFRKWVFAEILDDSTTVQFEENEQLDGIEAEHFIHNKFPDFLIDFIFYDGEIGHNLFVLSHTKLKNLLDYVFDLDILVNIQKDSISAAKAILEKNTDKDSVEILKLENEQAEIFKKLSVDKELLDATVRESKKIDLDLQKTETQIRNKNKDLNRLKKNLELLQSKHIELTALFKETIMYQMPILLNKHLAEKLSQKTRSALIINDEKLFNEKFKLLLEELGASMEHINAMSIFKSMMLTDGLPTTLKITQEEYSELLGKLKTNYYEIKQIEQSIKTKEASASSDDAFKTLLKRRDELEKTALNMKREISNISDKIHGLEQRLQELKKLLTQSFKTNQAVYASIKGYEELASISSVSKKLYEAELSEKLVEFNIKLGNNMSDFIKQYKNISSIQLDNNLKIVVKEKNKDLNIELLSAGQKQVLNFLLIKTILDFKNISSFLMVDTPFGRLSNSNKNLLLNSCYLKFDNLALLVTDSEYEYVQTQNLKHHAYSIYKGNLGSEIKVAS